MRSSHDEQNGDGIVWLHPLYKTAISFVDLSAGYEGRLFDQLMCLINDPHSGMWEA